VTPPKSTSTRTPKLHLKLLPTVKPAAREALFQAAKEAGALSVRPLFPESTDEELATLYTVDAKDAAAVPRLLKLQEHEAVEFVEEEVKRRLK